MTDEMMNYFRVIGEIQNEIKKANCFDEAIKVGVQKILQAFSSEYAILWYKEGESLHPVHGKRALKCHTGRTHDLSQREYRVHFPKL